MRIAFVGQKGFPATWGGVEVHVDAVARRLAARGHLVYVYVRRWYSGETDERVAGVRRIALPTVRGKHVDATVHSALAAADAVRRGVDIVHFHALGPALFALIPKVCGARVVTTIHGLDYRREKWGPIARAALRAGEASAFFASDQVVVVAEAVADHYRARGRQVVTIENGVDRQPALDFPEGFAALGLSPNQYVVSLGRWDEGKRVVQLIEAWGKRDSSIVLVVAGDSTDLEYGAAVREAASRSKSVILPGLVIGNDKYALLQHARGFISPSAHEGLPLVLLEALACGARCAVTDIPAHREVAMSVPGVELFPVDHPKRGIDKLLAGWSHDSDAQIAKVLRRYSWDRCVSELEAVYQDALH